MVLPATHDTGMYAGNILGKTQNLNLHEQLSAGARYFDLRGDGNLNIRHGIVYGPTLEEVLKSIQLFYSEGHQELAIGYIEIGILVPLIRVTLLFLINILIHLI